VLRPLAGEQKRDARRGHARLDAGDHRSGSAVGELAQLRACLRRRRGNDREAMIEAGAADVRGEAGVGELFGASIEKMLFKVRRPLLQRTLASSGG
jgi:hypothetical protein